MYKFLKTTLEWNLTWKFEASVTTHGKMAAFCVWWKCVLINLPYRECQIFSFNIEHNVLKTTKHG